MTRIRETGWCCSSCGELAADRLRIYREDGLFNTHSRRFGPWCLRCGRRACFRGDGQRSVASDAAGEGPSVIVLSGTCASGKSAVSFELSERHGFTQIDGDWILQLLKEELGRKVEAQELNEELLTMAHGIVALGGSAVVAHIVAPEHFHRYQRFLRERGISHRIVVLMPQESVLLARNLQRTCWPRTTPEYWVRKFRQDFLDGGESVARYFHDNSNETPAETATHLAG